MKTLHKHHVIPKHMGGSDSKDNIIYLSIAEHANEHLKLFITYKKQQDYNAWKSLKALADLESENPKEFSEIQEKQKVAAENLRKNGKIDKSVYKKIIETRRKNGNLSPWNKGLSLKNDPNNKSLLNISNNLKKAYNEGRLPCIGDQMRNKKFTENHKEKLKTIKLNAPKLVCPHCGKQAKAGMYGRWHGDKCKNRK